MPTRISKLKKKLDKVFSEYIRRRNADHLGFITCFTCGVKRHWKENQKTLKGFTALRQQPKIILDNVTILKNKIRELRNRLNELVDRRI